MSEEQGQKESVPRSTWRQNAPVRSEKEHGDSINIRNDNLVGVMQPP